jgi:putative hydrolase of HD superfamily
MADKANREQAAADGLFSLLPADQDHDLRAAWEEFEARETPEARFAAALDRLQPVLHNLGTEGHAWRQHGITRRQVLEMNSIIGEVAPTIWQVITARIDDATERGWLR